MNDHSWRRLGQRLALGMLALVALASSVLAADRVMLGREGDRPVGAHGNPQTAAELGRVRALAASSGAVRVIVGLRAAFAPEGLLTAAVAAQQRSEIAQKRMEVLARLPAVAGRPNAQRTFETIPFVGLTVSPAELETLVQAPEVTSIQEDAPRKPSLAISVPHIGASAAWSNGYTGAGQAVAVLDTGVDKNHPFLAGKVVSEACYSSTFPGYWSSVCPGGATESTATGSGVPCGADCGHGTHVAGIVAGSDGPSSMAGVAKGASLIAVQVFTELWRPEFCGSDPLPCIGAFPSDYIKGLERILALRNTFSIAAVNLSLGGGAYQSQPSCDSANSAEKAAIDNLRAVGIATVVASGNEGYSNALAAPACISTAISVGSTWSRTGYVNNCLGNSLGVSALDSVSCFSNSASFLNLLAPGAVINSSVPGSGYAIAAGTSQAAPHVAGAWALMKQKKPTATVTEILNSLTETGQSILDPRNGIVKPRINVAQAVASLGAGLPPQLLNVSKSGSGVVTSSPAGIDCGTTCSGEFAHGTTVTLSATPSPGYSFAGWSGDCSGMGCSVVMTAGRSVLASFTQPQFTLSVSKAGGGTGTVTSVPSGISCGSMCSAAFGSGAVVTLIATPSAGNVFAGWSGACAGTGSCVVTVNADTSVTASFSASPGGNGTITPLIQTNLSASANTTLNYSVVVPPGARNLVVRISGGTGDADLYVRAGQPPTQSLYDCRPHVPGNEEICSFGTPTPGTYYIMLNAAAPFAGVSLIASYVAGSPDISQIIYLLLLSD